MDAKTILLVAEKTAASLLSTSLEQPFGPDFDVFMVAGKMFLLFGDGKNGIATVKCSPEDGEALRRDYPEITPGYHMNKRHWVTLYPGPNLDTDLVADLVKNSYLLVANGIPKRIRPELSGVRFSSDFR